MQRKWLGLETDVYLRQQDLGKGGRGPIDYLLVFQPLDRRADSRLRWEYFERGSNRKVLVESDSLAIHCVALEM